MATAYLGQTPITQTYVGANPVTAIVQGGGVPANAILLNGQSILLNGQSIIYTKVS